MTDPTLDALLPPQMAQRAQELGIRKAALPADVTFVLAVLGGAFIALGAVFSTVAAAGSAGLPFGLARVLIGLVFSLGLILVVVGGAELFTGNVLIIMAWVGRQVSTRRLLRNWALVIVGNAVGALGTAALTFGAGHYGFGRGAVGAAQLATAQAKFGQGFLATFVLGILGNALVCLAIWLSFSARSTTDRVLAVVPPVAAFVAAGFEHCIADLYLVPVALLTRDLAPAAFWAGIGSAPEAFVDMSWGGFLTGILLPATLGNMVGGGLLVGLVYWFVYLRHPAGG